MKLMVDLEELGVDVKEGLGRVLGDESLYRTMLGMFVDVVGKNPIQAEDFDCENCEELIRRVHMLKGTAGNLAIRPLFVQYTEILNLLREGRQGEAKAAFVQVGEIQDRVIDCIKRSENV